MTEDFKAGLLIGGAVQFDNGKVDSSIAAQAPRPQADARAIAPAAGAAPTEAMVDAYLLAQQQVVGDADRFGCLTGVLDARTIRESCRAGLAAAIGASAPAQEAEEAAHPTAPRSQKNEGHGHVFSRPDGVKARCGGPGICPQCNLDAARARQEGGA